jgi:hypothetical protein
MLPAELWKNIALQHTSNGRLSPKVYMLLSLVCSRFTMDTATLQNYYLREYKTAFTTEYKLPNGMLHSPQFGLLPAVNNTIYEPVQKWYVCGVLHRGDDNPAIIYGNGSREWYVCGKRHRLHLPALLNISGTSCWYVDGNLHRDDDLPACVFSTGRREWYVHGQRYRVEGDTDGHPHELYYINGKQYTR